MSVCAYNIRVLVSDVILACVVYSCTCVYVFIYVYVCVFVTERQGGWRDNRDGGYRDRRDGGGYNNRGGMFTLICFAV